MSLYYNKTRIAIIESPAVEPVTVDEFKLFARIDNDDEDTALSSMLIGVREAAENYLGRKLISQKLRYTLDKWEGRETELPYAPLISVEGVYLREADGTFTEYDSDNYFVVTDGIPGSVVLKTSATPPSNTAVEAAGYRIDYLVGYGDTASSVPSAIKEAIKIWANNSYANRVITVEPPQEVRQSLSLFRVPRIT